MGTIDKKVISVTGKKELLKVYFEGQLIDGINHSFTSDLTANCEILDVTSGIDSPLSNYSKHEDMKKQS